MKLEVFGQPAEKEQVLRLRLIQETPGKVALVAVDERGNPVSQGYILLITKEGALRRCTYVGKELGLRLDDKQRIKLDEE